ncbi:TlpA family protein disulfide reductase [Persicirhabdus sediminis]|uniref:TlpA family protein disulfide reductase n=2 Tax=Persicirhabdus sediminis TaxID=454144 RepID=A0A8J7SIJ6_9BACT|nr:TlpA family protein disulfide reductase [Persicirhabdus sediminis]
MVSKKWTLMATLSMSMIAGTCLAGTQKQAQQLVDDHQLLVRSWERKMKAATTLEQQQALQEKYPKIDYFSRRMKAELQGELTNDWTLDYSAWLLIHDQSMTVSQVKLLTNAVKNNHLLSPKVGKICLAMALMPLPEGTDALQQVALRREFSETIRSVHEKNPDKIVKGQAALALALMMGDVGDASFGVRERLTLLREAITESADVKFFNTTVGQLASEEVYIITYLSKGRQAPEINGPLSNGQMKKLSDYHGKVVCLYFWSSQDDNIAQTLEMMRGLKSKYEGQPFELLGVNVDSPQQLALVEKEAIATWDNFTDAQRKISQQYRIKNWPTCIVLDKSGVIRFKDFPSAFMAMSIEDLLRTK